MAESDAFHYLKPLCVELAQKPTYKSISELQNALQLVPKDVFKEENMVKYIFFPLKLTVQRISRQNEKLLIKALECICFIFSSNNLKSEQLFLEVFDICCVLLSSRKQAVGREMLAEIAEELKMRIVILMNILLVNSIKIVLLCLFSKPVLPRLGHAISLLLALSEFEKDREVRLESIQCLQHLTLKHKNVSTAESQQISDTYCSFIPGISMSLSRILTDTSNTGQNIVTSVVETLQEFIQLVMGDSKFSFLQQSVSQKDIASKLKAFSNIEAGNKAAGSTSTSNERKITIERDRTWMEKTASNLSVLIDRFAQRVAYHSSPKVRLATISLAESLLRDCSESMASSVQRLVEVLAGMQHDDYEIVSDAAKKALEGCRVALNKGGRSLQKSIEEKFYEKLLSLPRIMKSANDDQKLIVLNILLGYLNLLGEGLANVLNSMSVLEKLLKSFVQALELDVRDVKIVEERNPVSYEDMIDQSTLPPVANIFPHRFKNFKNIRIFQAIQKICYSIGKFADLNVVVDYLLEVFLSSSVHRKEVVLFLNDILCCRIEIEIKESADADTPVDNRQPIAVIVDKIISTYLRDEFWYLPTSNVSDVSGSTKNFLEDQLAVLRTEERADQLSFWEKGIPIEKINSNIQLICLMINGVSICSGIKNFNVFLIRVLYPLMEKLGNENALIATAALNALSVISRNCVDGAVNSGTDSASGSCNHVKEGTNSNGIQGSVKRPYEGASSWSNFGDGYIGELILNNADYLVNSISMSFRHLTLLSSAPCVLSVMLTYSNKDILPLVADVIQDVFNCLDLYQEEVAFPLMKVLKSLASAVHIWFGKEADDDDDEENKKEVSCMFLFAYLTTTDEVVKYYSKHKQKLIDDRYMEWNDVVTPEEFSSFINDYCRRKMEALGGVEEEEEITENMENVEETEKDPTLDQNNADRDEIKKIPVHFKVTISALEKCQHFLPAKDLTLRLLTLDVIESCIQALKQRQNDLLPAVHKVWPSVVERIKDSQHVIVARTFEVISTMANCTGDFLRQRLKKDVYPFVVDYLTKQRNTSLKGGPMYRFSPSCKLQTRLLILISSVIQKVGLSNEDMWQIAIGCSEYLDCRQPLVLQIEAANVFKNLRKIDWSKTWLILTSLYSSEEFTAPNSCFKDIHLSKERCARNVFTDNVKKILYNDNLCV